MAGDICQQENANTNPRGRETYLWNRIFSFRFEKKIDVVKHFVVPFK